ncbi:MAG: extracellular solute-binding protein [Lachnospiraceae bacterium]|nr:extracellular solute-binding protein [Lachnospiraceae bacterium]
MRKRIMAEAIAVMFGVLMLGCGHTSSAPLEAPGQESSVEEFVDLGSTAGNKETGSTADSANADGMKVANNKASSAEPVELVVFAAASMTETLTEIADMYRDIAPNVTIVYNFDSSGTLKTQIEEGADCDIFISAAEKQMNELDASLGAEKKMDDLDDSSDAEKQTDDFDDSSDAEKKTNDLNDSSDVEKGKEERTGFVLQGTRTDLLWNRVTLAVPEGNPSGIKSFEQLAESLKDGGIMLAMGNADVPVGQYTQKILAYYDLDEEELAGMGVITYCSNVKEVTTQISEAAVDCGIIYATDAFSAGLDIVDTASEEMCGKVIYPAAVLNVTHHEAEAKDFLEYLTGADAAAVFESVGFTPLS